MYLHLYSVVIDLFESHGVHVDCISNIYKYVYM